jgi:hypothetical protein
MRGSKSIAALAGFAALCSASFAGTNDDTAVRATYAKLVHAMKSKNTSELKALYAPGYTETALGKTMTVDQVISQYKMMFTIIKTYAVFDVKVTSVKVAGKNATASTTYRFVGNVAQQGQTHKLILTGKTSDKLVKTGKGWLFQSEVDHDSEATMDGKKIPLAGG